MLTRVKEFLGFRSTPAHVFTERLEADAVFTMVNEKVTPEKLGFSLPHQEEQNYYLTVHNLITAMIDEEKAAAKPKPSAAPEPREPWEHKPVKPPEAFQKTPREVATNSIQALLQKATADDAELQPAVIADHINTITNTITGAIIRNLELLRDNHGHPTPRHRA